jgi:BASS family bile acid:Na+ symporter
MSVDQVISLLALITLVEMMVSIGLGVTLADVARVATNGRLLARAALASYVCVPAAAVGLLFLYRADPYVSAGFLIVAVCPGAPYGPPFTGMARGNVVMSVGLMILLAGSSAVLAPVLLYCLLPVVAADAPVQVDAGKMLTTLLLTQFLPLCVGLWLRSGRPRWADRLKKPADLLCTLLNLLLLGTILVAQFRLLVEIRPLAYLGMLVLVGAAGFAGWLLGERGSENRKAMTMATSIRNVGVGLVIATGSLPATKAVTAVTAYAILQTIVMAVVAAAWGRLARGAAVPGELRVDAGLTVHSDRNSLAMRTGEGDNQ